MGQVESGSSASDLIEGGIQRIVLENSTMRVSILPELGGKIASIETVPDGEELLQQPLQPYAARTPYMRFEDSDASGWDECLPSVAACEIKTASQVTQVPDHGDFWQIPWETGSRNGNALVLSAGGFSLPLRFSKMLRLDGSCLRVSYHVRNISAGPVEYVWSAHPSFSVEPGDRIVLPESVKETIVEGSARGRLGKPGTKQTWPKASLTNNTVVDLSLTGKITDEIGDKLFAASPPEGWCAIERTRLNRRVELRFDPRELPYLGLWICYGGWPEQAANRQQCVALEPCTTEGDSLKTAMEEGRARRLAARAEDRWSLELWVS